MDITITPTAYEQAGVRYDRITSVIHRTWPDPSLQDWRASVGKVRADRALRHGEKIGKLVDKQITGLLRGEPMKAKLLTAIEVKQAMRAFTEWHRLNPFQPTALQQTLLDPQARVGGTPDCLSDEGFDWKVTGQLGLPHLLQINRYWRLAEAQGISLRQYRLVRFDKILGIWEERILTPDGILWDGQQITRETLDHTFAYCLGLYRSWQVLTQQEVAA